MRWSEKETYQFVKIYLSHENLWNPEHIEYKLKDKRLHSYNDIIAEFRAATGIKLNNPEVRTKIKNLKSTYLQEIYKIRKRSGPNSTYRPNMRWFADWHKCFNSFSRTKLDDTLYNEQEDTNQEIWINNIENSTHDPFISEDDCNILILKSDPDDKLIKQEHRGLSRIKKRSSSNHLIRNSRSSVDCDTASVIRDDEFEIYGKYIASQLRTMELKKALRLQLEIQTLVSEARISDMSD